MRSQSEFSSAKRKNLSVSIMAIGYPIGGVFGGKVVQPTVDRRRLAHGFLFRCGSDRGVHSAGAPCSCRSRCTGSRQKQPAGALDKINRAMKRWGTTDRGTAGDLGCGAQALDRGYFRSGTDRNDVGPGDRVFLPRHDLLLCPEVDSEDRGGPGVRGLLRGGRADVGEPGRSDRWRRARPAGPAVWNEAAHHRGHDHWDGDGDDPGPLRRRICSGCR